jgi:hypothetical protein
MPQPKLLALRCKVTPAMFSGECVFIISLADQTEHKGVASVDFIWDSNRKPMRRPPEREIEGFVAARFVRNIDDEQQAVEIPDGEVVAVRRDTITARPTAIVPPTLAHNSKM